MKVNKFKINIIDTAENTTVLSEELTGLSACKFSYHGVEEKYANLLTSEFRFNFLVKDNTEAAFFHLFTGSEKRFKAEVVDVSVKGFPNTIWTGFLLPEQFNEPYKHSNFFVDFTATDGIALLKNTAFVVDEAAVNKSVLQVINQCLLQTNLELPILFSPAIQNAGFNVDFLDIEVNTSAYVSTDGVAKSYYDVLSKMLLDLGCVLFLFENTWFIVGLNRFKEETISFTKYTLNVSNDLEFSEKVAYQRDRFAIAFQGVPNITVAPPLKKVTVSWDADNSESLIPEDAANHLPVYIATDPDDITAKYWDVVTDKGGSIFVYYYTIDDAPDVTQYYNGYIATSNKDVDNPFEGLIFQGDPILTISGTGSAIAFSDLPNNYITLSDAFFVNGSSDLERYATLSIEFQKGSSSLTDDLNDYFNNEGFFSALADNGSGETRVTSNAHGLETGDSVIINSTTNYTGEWLVTKIDANNFDIAATYVSNDPGTWKINPFKNIFHFAITYKEHLTDTTEEIYLSNFETTGVPNGMYDFNLSLNKDVVKGTLNLEKILLLNDGYYNLRIYLPVTHALLSAGNIMFISNLSFTLNGALDFEIEKNRTINFSTFKELDVFHNSSRTNLSKKSYLFSDALQSDITDTTLIPGQFLVTPIASDFQDVNASNGNLWYTKAVLVLEDADVFKLQNGYILYVVKSGTSVLVEVPASSYVISENTLTQIQLANVSAVFIEDTDVLYLRDIVIASDLHYPEYWLDKWQRYDAVDAVGFNESLCDMYHNLSKDYNFKVRGTAFGLVGPLDVLEFNYKESDLYYPLTIEMDLSAGKTEITMIETKNENVTDYAE